MPEREQTHNKNILRKIGGKRVAVVGIGILAAGEVANIIRSRRQVEPKPQDSFDAHVQSVLDGRARAGAPSAIDSDTSRYYEEQGWIAPLGLKTPKKIMRKSSDEES